MKSSERLRGFTLIEVLVALTIVVIAFMAMYGSMMPVAAAGINPENGDGTADIQ